MGDVGNGKIGEKVRGGLKRRGVNGQLYICTFKFQGMPRPLMTSFRPRLTFQGAFDMLICFFCVDHMSDIYLNGDAVHNLFYLVAMVAARSCPGKES